MSLLVSKWTKQQCGWHWVPGWYCTTCFCQGTEGILTQAWLIQGSLWELLSSGSHLLLCEETDDSCPIAWEPPREVLTLYPFNLKDSIENNLGFFTEKTPYWTPSEGPTCAIFILLLDACNSYVSWLHLLHRLESWSSEWFGKLLKVTQQSGAF